MEEGQSSPPIESSPPVLQEEDPPQAPAEQQDPLLTPTGAQNPPEEPGQPEESYEAENGPQHTGEEPDNPEEDPLGAELEQLRQWKAKMQQELELHQLRDLKARFNAGDNMARQSLLPAVLQTGIEGQSRRSTLPRPEPPHTYKRKNTHDYRRWKRDCESYFIRSPADFPTEAHKVDFGLSYISEVCRTSWTAYLLDERLKDPLFSPTWAQLTQRMIDALGTPAERQQEAYNAIKSCKQTTNQNPTDLLNYLRPYWEELATPPAAQVLEYTGALDDEIQKDLQLLAVERRNTVTLVEEQANLIYRRLGMTKKDKSSNDKDNKKRLRKAGDTSTPKKSRSSGWGSNNSSSTQKEIICYRCDKPGHKASDCLERRNPGNTSGTSTTSAEKQT